ncbi:hypothetical protein V8E36_003702, partial [Tilletia maclaganii]
MNKQPFSSLHADDVAVVRAYGRRKCWPDQDYDFFCLHSRLLASPDSPATSFLRQLATDGRDKGDSSADVRGAGPYGPLGEVHLGRLALNYLLNEGLELPLATKRARQSIPRLAIELLRVDLGFDIYQARSSLWDGVLYGRVVFPVERP